MLRGAPRSTRKDSHFPYTARFRSVWSNGADWAATGRAAPPVAPSSGVWAQAARARRHAGRARWKRGIGPVWALSGDDRRAARSEEHTSELQSLMRISYAVFCLKKTTNLNKST